jgi:hypothetical protein
MDVGMADVGQGLMMSPRIERRRTPSSGCFWHRLWLMGISPWQMDVDHDGQDPTSHDWTISRACGSLDMLVWHVWHDAGGPGGQRSTHLVVIMP